MNRAGRIEYLDLIKGIAIILVVFCHRVALSDETFLGNVVMAIAWAAVPNFFFVTGGVMHRSNTLHWKKHIRKIVRAYIVLCVWKVIYLIYFSIGQSLIYSKVDLVKYLFLFGDIQNVDTSIMWFMYAYIAVLVFFPISYYLFQSGKAGRKILIFVEAILFVSTFAVSAGNFFFAELSRISSCNLLQISISTIIPFGGWPNMLFCFIAGVFLLQYREKINCYMDEKQWRRWIPMFLFGIGTAGLLFVKWRETGLICWGGVYITDGYNRIMTIILAVGLYLILERWKIRKAGRLIARYIGTMTMGIYFIHRLLLAFFQVQFGYIYEQYGSFGLNLLKTAVAVVICVFVTMLLKKIPIVRELVQ